MIDRASPRRIIHLDGRVTYSLDEFDMSVFDQDVASTRENAAFLVDLVEQLDNFYFDVTVYHINADDTIRRYLPILG
ncbi:hypothetical protein D3C78_1822930 [compost metagenome]